MLAAIIVLFVRNGLYCRYKVKAQVILAGPVTLEKCFIASVLSINFNCVIAQSLSLRDFCTLLSTLNFGLIFHALHFTII